MSIRRLALGACVVLSVAAATVSAQERDVKVRNDRKQFENDANWVYNDLAKASAAAKESGKPLLVVFR